MNFGRKKVFVLGVAVFMISLVSLQAQEKTVNYPTKGITILCPTAAGGSLDITARTLAVEMEKSLKVNITVVNKGGGAAIGVSEFGKTTKADGYTIMIIDKGLISNYEIGVFAFGWRDFEPVASLNKGMMFFVVSDKTPYHTLGEFIEAAKKAPDTLTLGTPGSAGIGFLNAVGFMSASGTPAKIVPFGSGADTKAALAGGHVSAAFLDGSEIMPLVKAGMIRALACSDVKRSSLLPEVLTLKDLGVDFVLTQAKSLWVPKGTPKGIVEILTKAAQEAVNSAAFRKLCADTSQEPEYMTPDEMTSYFTNEEAVIRKLVRDSSSHK